MSARISVVMVSWRTGPLLAHAMAAALAAPDVDELVLVNNGNPPEMERRLRALAMSQPRLILVEGQGNVGFAKGCNLGARAALGDMLLFLNPDTALEPGAATRMAAAGAAAKRPWAVGARLINLDGSEQRGARRGALTPSSALVSFCGLHNLRKFAPALRDIHREREALPDAPVPTPVVSGAAVLLRADDYAALGGFDEAYFLHVEDIDLCRRVAEAGGEVMFAPQARVMHHGSTSDASLLRVEWAKARGFVRYFWKFGRGPAGRAQAALTAPLVVAAIMGRALLFGLRGRLSGR
jgi:GT2 family glycosyltransferase